ncbi:MAG: 3-dehydroquinate synthase, partial [Nitrospirota bacterium]|nr:3-dehydroquinate synthase [Nitrospirota bacterium]
MKQTKKIPLDLGQNSYDIFIGEGVIDQVGLLLKGLSFKGRVAVVTDPKVEGLYGSRVKKSLKKAGFKFILIQIPA